MKTSLIFVYNTDRNPLCRLFDFVHRLLLSPSTFRCSLHALTTGLCTEKTAWMKFRDSIAMPMEFLRRREFEKKYDLRFPYPVILRKNGNIDVLMSKREIDALESLDGLIAALTTQLAPLHH